MPRPERTWEVTKHDAIEKLDDNLWAVRSGLPGRATGDRRMVIAKMQNGELVFYNAAPLEEASMAEIAAWGKPAYLILPSNLHMMDGHAFQNRLNLRVYGPKGDTKMAARVKVTGALEDFPGDAHVQVCGAAGTRSGEAVMVVTSPDGKRTSLAFADVFMNIPLEGASLFARVVGFAGGAKIPWLMQKFVINDRGAFKQQWLKWADLPSMTRLIPSHGQIVREGAAGVLRELAGKLS